MSKRLKDNSMKRFQDFDELVAYSRHELYGFGRSVKHIVTQGESLLEDLVHFASNGIVEHYVR